MEKIAAIVNFGKLSLMIKRVAIADVIRQLSMHFKFRLPKKTDTNLTTMLM